MEKTKKNPTTLILIGLIIVVLVLIVVILFTSKKDTPTDPTVKDPVVDPTPTEKGTITDFDLSYLQLENNKKNMVYSPLSIKSALYMLRDGADGETQKEIDNIIKGTSLQKYNSIDKVLSFANALYIRDTYKEYIKESYKNDMQTKYGAEVQYDAFNSATNINKWIEDKTLGIIKNLLKDEQFSNPDLKMLLINALAIDMEWSTKFAAADTHGVDFTLADGSKLNATMMQRTANSDDASYYQGKDATVVSMDLKKYEDTQFEFIAILPEEDLSTYISNLKVSDIESLTKKLKKTSEEKNKDIYIRIPKFKYKYNLEFDQDLQTQGMKLAFNPDKADFTNMTDNKPFFVGGAIHSADIDFSEDGIKAAAVTVITMFDNAAVQEKEIVNLNFDRPFMYLIRDKSTKEIWFVGTVYEPNSWEKDKDNYKYE